MVNQGKIQDDRFFGLIKAADPEDDPTDPETWYKANPSLGVTITLESFAQDVNEAKKSPASMNALKRYRLDIWTTGESVWLDSGRWELCRAEFDFNELLNRRCWMGLDLGQTRDTTSVQLIFPWDDGTYRILSFFWLPEATAQAQNHLVPWLQWAEQGHVILTPGDVCDYAFVMDEILNLAESFNVQCLLFDPWNADAITAELENEHGMHRMKFAQNLANFAGPSATFEREIIAGRIRHLGNPVMDWMIGNATVYTDPSGNKRPKKPKHDDFRKIDGVVAAVMAMAGVLSGEAGEGPSIYENPNDDDRTVFF